MKKIWLVVVCVVGAAARMAWAVPAVPNILHYQSFVTDEGGNPLPDGSVEASFQIQDVDGRVLFEERQQVNVLGGVISAGIGAGRDANADVPSGGVPSEVLAPDGPRLLSVHVDGVLLGPPLEIASVPYALFAQQALDVAAGSIELRHLSAQGVRDLANALTQEDILGDVVTAQEVESLYGGVGGAARIGIAPGLSNSGRATVQEVLQDIDRAVRLREEQIVAEASARQSADSDLQRQIASEFSTRATADASLQQQIDQKISRSGDTMTGDLNMASGRRVDGYDISTALSSLNNIAGVLVESKIDPAIARDSELNQGLAQVNARIDGVSSNVSTIAQQPQIVAWGRIANGNVIRGHNVASVDYPASGVLRVRFAQALGGNDYAVILTPSTGIFSTDPGEFRISATSPLAAFNFLVLR